MVICVFFGRIKRCQIVMLAILKVETFVKDLAELLIVDFLKAWAGSQSQELEELSQLLI